MSIDLATWARQRRIYHPIQRDAAIFLETAEESGGARTLLEVELAPGGRNEPHRHLTYAEHFEAVEGDLTVRLGRASSVLSPGEQVVAPPGSAHCFANETAEVVRFLVELRPGHRGFEQALQIGYGLARDGRCDARGLPRDIRHLAVLGDMSDIRLCGAMRALEPVMHTVARRARARGLDAELIERYVAW
jgi:quercetin dioxygenase-like cupin family protein